MDEGREGRQDPGAARLEELTRRHARLVERRIGAEAELRSAQRDEARLREAAEARYGTSDPAKLREMHATLVAENDAKLADFARQLDEVEADLGRIEATERRVG